MLFTLVLAVSTGLHGQTSYEAGIRAGANFSTQSTTGLASDVETGWRPGFHLGIYGSLFYTEKLAGQLEFLYSQKGSLWSDPYSSGDEVVSYLDVPVLARFQALDLLNVYAGPQFSFLTGAWRLPDDGIAYSVKENYDGVDVGLVVGAELNLPIRLNITLRYIEGLIVTTDPRYYTDPWKNRVIQLSLSYSIIYI